MEQNAHHQRNPQHNPQHDLQHNTSTKGDNIPGWPSVASYMAETSEFQAFSRFRELNVKNLLYYQVEIAYLEDKLRRQELKDWEKRRMSEEENYAKLAEVMVRSKDGPDSKQWNLIIQIRERVKEYSKICIYGIVWILLTLPLSCRFSPTSARTDISIARTRTLQHGELTGMAYRV
jgi:hypothetical protein